MNEFTLGVMKYRKYIRIQKVKQDQSKVNTFNLIIEKMCFMKELIVCVNKMKQMHLSLDEVLKDLANPK